MTSKKRKKKSVKIRNANLAYKPPEKVYESKQAIAVNNGADPFEEGKKPGKNSYILKAQQSGDYEQIGWSIRAYRDKNPNSTYMDVYRDVLYKRYPWIFENEPSFYDGKTGNISKMINGDKKWRKAYFMVQDELIAGAELKMSELIPNENLKNVTYAYDVLMKYKLAKEQLDKISDDTDNIVEIIPFSNSDDEDDDICKLD